MVEFVKLLFGSTIGSDYTLHCFRMVHKWHQLLWRIKEIAISVG